MLVLSVMFGLVWLTLFVGFHLASGLVHVLIALAVVSLAIHFFRPVTRLPRRRSPGPPPLSP